MIQPAQPNAYGLFKKEVAGPGALRHEHRHGPGQRLVRGAIIRGPKNVWETKRIEIHITYKVVFIFFIQTTFVI